MRQAHLFYLVTLPRCPPFLVSSWASACSVSIHTHFLKKWDTIFGAGAVCLSNTALMAVEGELRGCTFPDGPGRPWAPQSRLCRDKSVGDVDTSFRAGQREARMSLGLGILAVCGAGPSLPQQPTHQEQRRGPFMPKGVGAGTAPPHWFPSAL